MSTVTYGDEVARLGTRLRFQHFMLLHLLGEGNSMREAALALNVTQPALSSSLRQIEEALDARLFVRTSRGLQPTVQGAAAARAAARLLQDLGRVKQEVASGARDTTLMRIGAPHFIAHGYLPDVIGRLRRSAQYVVHTEIHEGPVPDLFSELGQGRLDALITTYSGVPARVLQSLQKKALFQSKFVVAAPAAWAVGEGKRRVGLADLAGQSWILPSARSMLRREFDAAFLRQGLTPPVSVVESSNPVTNLKLVRSGVGLSLLPKVTIEAMGTAGIRLLPVHPLIGSGPVALFHHPSEPAWRVSLLSDALSRPGSHPG
jgi:LysR family transcriptional regulator, regulator of abg operon